jgi:hypothetical protein
MALGKRWEKVYATCDQLGANYEHWHPVRGCDGFKFDVAALGEEGLSDTAAPVSNASDSPAAAQSLL